MVNADFMKDVEKGDEREPGREIFVSDRDVKKMMYAQLSEYEDVKRVALLSYIYGSIIIFILYLVFDLMAITSRDHDNEKKYLQFFVSTMFAWNMMYICSTCLVYFNATVLNVANT